MLIYPATASLTHTADMPLPVLWQDEHLIAIYKPAGWLVHRTGLDAGETRFIVQTLRDQIGQRVYPLHRLDKGTCGVLLLALHSEAASRMGTVFEAHAMDKRYLALVRGWAPPACAVDHALRPDDAPPDAPVQSALTHFERLATLNHPDAYDPRFAGTRLALVQAAPLTGRRHQIRRHLKHISHPIIGDATHGKGPLNRWWADRLGLQRLWLHAWSLGFTHPYTGQALHIHSGLQAAPLVPQHADPVSAPDSGVPTNTHPSLLHWHSLIQQAPWQRDKAQDRAQ